MYRLFTINKKHSLLYMLLVGITMSVLLCHPLAQGQSDSSESGKAATRSKENTPDPNTPPEQVQDKTQEDPNKPAVSRDSTDIEELLVESKKTVDQEVVREQKEKREAKAAEKPDKEEVTTETEAVIEEKKEVVPKPDVPEVPETVDEKPPTVVEKPDETKIVTDRDEAADVQQDSTDVEELIEEVKITPRQRFEDQYIQKLLLPYNNFKQSLYDKHRISLAMEQVLIYQRATGGRRPREQSVYNFSLFGLWQLSEEDQEDRGVVGFLFEERDNVTRHNVEDFSREVGSTFRTHTLNSSERSRTAFRQLWWRKKYAEDTVTLTIGKLHHASYYNRNAYAGSSRTHFLSSPFARNPNRLLPQDGLGANVKIKPNDNYYLSVGFGDARSDLKSSGFDTIQDGDLMTMAEIGFTPKDGNYRFTIWHTDETEIDGIPSFEGSGFAFSFDHELYEKVGVFGRYGYTEPEVQDMTNFVSAGFVWQDPWGIAGDLFGCGVSWDENSDTDEDEFAFEVFHRMQATKMLQVTPSILVIFEPTRSEKTEPVAVFGLRARMLF
ncbi:MAG: carbohydrate porin [Planctomycetota bacterium]